MLHGSLMLGIRVSPALCLFHPSNAIPWVGPSSCSLLSAHLHPRCYPSPGLSDFSSSHTSSFRMLASGWPALRAINKATHHQLCLEMLTATSPTAQQRKNLHPFNPGQQTLTGWEASLCGALSYLLPLVEAFSVAVGEVDGTGDHPLAALELLQGCLHVPAAGALRTGIRWSMRPCWRPCSKPPASMPPHPLFPLTDTCSPGGKALPQPPACRTPAEGR